MSAIPHINFLKNTTLLISQAHYSINWTIAGMIITCAFICFLIPDCSLKQLSFFYRCLLSAANIVFMMLGMAIGHDLGMSFHFPKMLAFFSMVFMMSIFSAMGFVILLRLAHSIRELFHYQQKSV